MYDSSVSSVILMQIIHPHFYIAHLTDVSVSCVGKRILAEVLGHEIVRTLQRSLAVQEAVPKGCEKTVTILGALRSDEKETEMEGRLD